MNLSELALHFRLYNYFIKSGAAENKIESFIASIGTGDVSPEEVIELVYELHEISKSEPIPLDQVHIISKDESKNVSIEAINEHIQLKEELKKYRLSTRISIQT